MALWVFALYVCIDEIYFRFCGFEVSELSDAFTYDCGFGIQFRILVVSSTHRGAVVLHETPATGRCRSACYGTPYTNWHRRGMGGNLNLRKTLAIRLCRSGCCVGTPYTNGIANAQEADFHITVVLPASSTGELGILGPTLLRLVVQLRCRQVSHLIKMGSSREQETWETECLRWSS